MSLIIKCDPVAARSDGTVEVTEVPYGTPTICLEETAFIWFSETSGGTGLAIRGRIEEAARDENRIRLRVRILDHFPIRALTIDALKPHRDSAPTNPLITLAHKLYRHAHNKISELTEPEEDFLNDFF